MDNQTIAEQLNIKEFPFEIKDKNGNEIYYENSNKSWFKQEYNQNGNIIYYENSNKYWEKLEYNQNGNLIYWESSNCVVRDNRPKNVELTMDEIARAFNIPVEQLKIKK